MKRIVVTGVGMINALGHDKSSFEAILRGECGVGEVTLCETDGLSTTIAAEVKDFDPTSVMKKKEVKKADRFIQLGLHAGDEALKDAGLHDVDVSGFGVVSTNCMTGIGALESVPSGRRNCDPAIPLALDRLMGGAFQCATLASEDQDEDR